MKPEFLISCFRAFREWSEPRRLLALFILGFAVRLAFLIVYGLDAPLVDWGDDDHYDRIAHQLLAEGRYSDAWFPPGYSVLLALVYSLPGPDLVMARIAQALLGAATCCLVYLVGRSCFSREVGLLSAVLLALYPGHLFMTWRLMAEVSFMFLILLALWLALALTSRPSWAKALGFGASLALANSFKSNLILFSPLVLIWVGWELVRRRDESKNLFALALASFLLGSMFTPAANYVATGVPMLLAENGGSTFWWSNNPIADGYFVDPSDDAGTQQFIEQQGLADALRESTDQEKVGLYRRLGLLWIGHHPRDFLRLCVLKLRNAFGIFPRAAAFQRSQLATWAHASSYGLLLPFILGGMIGAVRAWRKALVLYMIFAGYLGMVLLFYGTPRFTLVVTPVLLIFASHCVIQLARVLRRRLLRAPEESGLRWG